MDLLRTHRRDNTAPPLEGYIEAWCSASGGPTTSPWPAGANWKKTKTNTFAQFSRHTIFTEDEWSLAAGQEGDSLTAYFFGTFTALVFSPFFPFFKVL